MKCPFCHEGEFAVIDSRQQQGGFPVRRRRACRQCGRRVWTAEEILDLPLKVIKKDGRREPFDIAKLRGGLEKACYKRPIKNEQLDQIIQQIENELYGQYFGEVSSTIIGDLVMKHLRDLDQVAYVRFASVYREFEDVNDFVAEVRPMLARDRNGTRGKRRASVSGEE